jgi:hypothetical protein
MKGGKVFLFEFADDVEAFLDQNIDGIQKLNEAVGVIGLQPSAQIKLKSIGVDVYNTLPFFGQKGHENLLDASEKMIREIRKGIKVVDKNGISESYSHFFVFYTRTIIHYLAFYLELLKQIQSVLNPSTLSFTANSQEPGQLELNSQLSYLGPVTNSFAKAHNIGYEHACTVKNKSGNVFLSFIKSILLNIGGKTLTWIMQKKLQREARKKTVVLALERSYNMPRLIDEIINSGDIIVYLNSGKYDVFPILKGEFIGLNGLQFGSGKNDPIFENSVKESLNSLKSSAALERFFYCEVDLWSWVEPWLEKALVPALRKLNFQTARLSKLLNKVTPRLVLSQHALGLGGSLGEHCLKRGIKAFLISHGSHVPPKGKFEQIEWSEQGRGLIDATYPFIAIQTPWAKRYVEALGVRLSKPICTGPLLFAKRIESGVSSKDNEISYKKELQASLFPELEGKKIILHAGTPKSQSFLRLFVFETIDEYIRNINSLIKVVTRMNNVHLIIRFRPVNDLNLAEFKELLVESESFTVRSDGSFSKFLLASDLLLSYGSAAIEEALQNKIPVLQYDFDGKYCHIPATQFNRNQIPHLDSCYYADSEENLAIGLTWLMENHLDDDKDTDVNWARHFFYEKDIVDHFASSK